MSLTASTASVTEYAGTVVPRPFLVVPPVSPCESVAEIYSKAAPDCGV